MANQKITDLTPITSTQINASNDVITLVDVSDTTMSNSGTNKKATIIEVLKKTTLSLLGDVNISSPTNGQVLTYNGSQWVNGSSGSGTLTVGTTPINNGNVGRVLFQGNGNILQQSANLFFDDAPFFKLNIGNASLTNSHFQVKAGNNLYNDNSIAVRDVFDHYYKYKLRNYGTWNCNINNSTMPEDNSACEIMADDAPAFIQIKGNETSGIGKRFKGYAINSPQKGILYYGLFINSHPYVNDNPAMVAIDSNKRFLFASYQTEKGWAFAHGDYPIGNNNTVFAIFPTNGVNGGGTLSLGTTLGTSINTIPTPEHGTNTFYIANGNEPTANVRNAFAMYSGNVGSKVAVPHFRTGDGDVIKLFKQNNAISSAQFVSNNGAPVLQNSTFGGYTIGQIVNALKVYGLLA